MYPRKTLRLKTLAFIAKMFRIQFRVEGIPFGWSPPREQFTEDLP